MSPRSGKAGFTAAPQRWSGPGGRASCRRRCPRPEAQRSAQAGSWSPTHSTPRSRTKASRSVPTPGCQGSEVWALPKPSVARRRTSGGHRLDVDGCDPEVGQRVLLAEAGGVPAAERGIGRHRHRHPPTRLDQHHLPVPDLGEQQPAPGEDGEQERRAIGDGGGVTGVALGQPGRRTGGGRDPRRPRPASRRRSPGTSHPVSFWPTASAVAAGRIRVAASEPAAGHVHRQARATTAPEVAGGVPVGDGDHQRRRAAPGIAARADGVLVGQPPRPVGRALRAG